MAAGPAVELVGSYELLTMIIRSAQVPGAGTAPSNQALWHASESFTAEDLGELHSGLVVVAASDLGDHVERGIRRASGLARKQLTADEARVERDVDAVVPGPDPGYNPAAAKAEAEAGVREAEA